jgi:hypothetical protein
MGAGNSFPVLKKSRWFLLKREENLKTEQRFRRYAICSATT